MQTSIVTRECSGVPFAGLHRAIRSGLGRPTEFLTMSVRKDVKIRLMKRPSIVTCNLCPPGLNMMAHTRISSNGKPPAYANSHAASYELRVFQPYAPVDMKLVPGGTLSTRA